MSFLRHVFATGVVLATTATMALADLPVLRAAVLKFGTVNWELNSIAHHGLDKANGFELSVQGMAGNSATRVAFQGGEADVVVADWIWVARQRAAGKDYVFIPYSKAVGALYVKSDSGIKDLGDLAGKKIGIAGGPVDKSWLLLRAYAEQKHGLDLAGSTEQVFGAPPLIFKSALSGEVDGAINFWHFGAKMEAKGLTPIMSVAEAASEMGLSTDTPLLGYVVKGAMLRDTPELVHGLYAASRAAKGILETDDAEWDRLRPKMNAKDDASFAALKAGFRAGIPNPGPVDEAAAAKLLELMAKLGGEKLVGDATSMPEGVFVQPGS